MANKRDPSSTTKATESTESTQAWLTAIPVGLLTLTSLVPTEAIGDDSLTILVQMWLLGAGVWLYVRYRHSQAIVSRRVDGWWCVAIVFVVLGAWKTLAGGDMRRGLNATFTWSIYPLAFWMIRDVFRDAVSRKTLAAWMLSLAVGLAGYGVYQFFIGMPATRAEFEGLEDEQRVKVLNEIGVGTDTASPQLKQFYDRLRSTEPYATFALANSLAGFLTTWSLLALPILVWGVLAKPPPIRGSHRLVAITGAVLVALCLVLTKSRASWLALAIGGALMSWRVGPSGWKRWTLPVGLVAVAGLLMGIGVILGTVDREVLTESHLSLSYRVQYWRAALEMIADHWLFGVGAGNFQSSYAQYKFAEASEQIADPHQLVLELWATLGLVPTLSILGYIAYRFATGWKDYLSSLEGAATDEVSAPAASQADRTAESTGRQRLSRATWCGGIAGGIAAVVLGLPFQSAVETFPGTGLPVVWFTTLPLAVVCFASWQVWVAVGPWRRWWCLLGVLTLLINLLAAGGIGFPAVATTLWCLLAISDRQPSPADRGANEPHARNVAAIALAILVVLTGIFVWSTARPVLERRRHLTQFQFAESVTAAKQHLRLAASADSLSPDPPRLLAELLLRQWVEEGSPQEAELRIAIDRVVATHPQSPSTRAFAGRIALVAHDLTGDRRWLQRGIEEFRAAARLYPNYAMSHARVAWALHLAGDTAAAAAAAERALQFDASHDHDEHKLLQLRVANLASPPWQPTDSTVENAEQTMRRLRNANR